MIKGKWPVHALLLQNPSVIPFDVSFKLVGNDNAKKEDAGSREIKAHKQLLASRSSVFLSMFFGSLKEEKDVISVEETTYESFEKLLEYIYQVDIDCQNMTLLELYDIVNLAERYDVPSLTEEIKIYLVNFPLTMDSLMDVAFTAFQFTQFTDVSLTLLRTCAKFLQRNIFGPENLLQFANDQFATARGDTALELLSLIEDLPPICDNCMEEKEECLIDQPVEQEKMAHGLLVKANWEAKFSARECQYNFTILSSNGNLVTVERMCDGPSGEFEASRHLVWDGVPNFVYNC